MKLLLGFLGLWFAMAFGLTVFAPPSSADPTTRLLIIAGPIVLSVLLIVAFPGFARVMRRIPVRTLILLHAVRFPIGALFIFLADRKLLPYDFAWPAGIGDVLAGGMALAIAAFFRRSAIPPALLVLWNVIGLADFLNVQRVVAALASAGRGTEFIAMQGPPVALVPYFVVPVLFFTHLYMLGRLAKSDRAIFVASVSRTAK
jgi:hypothetical protein